MNFKPKYAIRIADTKKYFPAVQGRNGRGGSHTEPEETDNPRLFKSTLAAKRFISSWKLGKYISDRGMVSGTWNNPPEYYEDIYIKEMPERVFISFEIIPLHLVSGYDAPILIKGKDK